MQRAKKRKLVATLPDGLPEQVVQEATGMIANLTTRAQIEAAYRRREAAR